MGAKTLIPSVQIHFRLDPERVRELNSMQAACERIRYYVFIIDAISDVLGNPDPDHIRRYSRIFADRCAVLTRVVISLTAGICEEVDRLDDPQLSAAEFVARALEPEAERIRRLKIASDPDAEYAQRVRALLDAMRKTFANSSIQLGDDATDTDDTALRRIYDALLAFEPEPFEPLNTGR
jgi:hypothetical protein